jgi:hypothetical protein
LLSVMVMAISGAIVPDRDAEALNATAHGLARMGIIGEQRK